MLASNNGAFSNRIKCIMSCIRKGSCKEILWIVNPKKVDVSFDSIFDNTEFNIINSIHLADSSLNEYNSSRLYVTDNDIPSGFSNINKDLTGIPYKDFPKDGRAIDHEYNKIPKLLQAEYRNILSRLCIKQNILESVQNFLFINSLKSNQFIAIHARTWNYKSLNHTKREACRRNTIDLEKIHFNILEIIKNNPSKKIFLASDNFELIDSFKNYPNVCHRNFSRSVCPDAINGFIDILIASYANELHLTLHSTFSEMIFWYNNNNPSVNFIY